MYTIRQQRSALSTAIIISLLIHLMLGTAATVHVYFSGQRQQQQNLSAPDLRAGRSDYGATVIFKDIPEAQETQKEQYPLQMPIGSSLTKQDERTNNDEKAEKQAQKSVQANTIKTSEPKEQGEKVIPAKQNMQKQQAARKKYGLPPRNPFARGKRDMSPAMQVTLASMARGFIEHMRDQGNDSVNSAGNRKPDFSDMQYISYLQRIGRNIQESIRRNNRVFKLPQDVNGITTVQFGIGRNGNITDLRLQNPTGVRDLDNFFKEAIADAAPFPPLPQHFKQDIFARQISFYVTMPQGIHRNPRWVAH